MGSQVVSLSKAHLMQNSMTVQRQAHVTWDRRRLRISGETALGSQGTDRTDACAEERGGVVVGESLE
jgi:hypothetical protein